ncbi:hypothetical protein QAD02_013279 [Eretmocerus hayati]|uniref:Uncharacterized protein n=1 Tax=Eretmocerus hayati TaxID=131215 RepID=A0ACC2P295_9HYME|nr:hypothetical protein QAD02_013279 [Eretmocerus hayati]
MNSETQKKKWNNKVITIAHLIILALRPRTFISPVLLSFSLILHRNHCSKEDIVTLSNLGACASYHETVVFENSIANDPEFYAIIAEALSQFAINNFDRNTATVDDHKTCHKLGLIPCVSPGSAVSSSRRIKRCPNLKSENIVKNCGFVPLVIFVPQNRHGLKNMVIANFKGEYGEFFAKSGADEKIKLLNMLWEYCKNLEPGEIDGWHGFMTKAFQHHSFTVPKVIPL